MKRKNVSKYFGCMVFDDRVMKASLSAKVYQSSKTVECEGVKLDSSVANRDDGHEGMGGIKRCNSLYPLVSASYRNHSGKT